MQIAIIGTGNVGRVLGRRWAEAGHAVTFGARDPDEADLQAFAGDVGAAVDRPTEAAATADVVLLAVPGHAVVSVAEALDVRDGAIVIDCTNPLGADLTPQFERSTAEHLAALVPAAHVVKAFNTTGTKNMADPVYPGGRLVMPLCGDDADAKAVVADLAAALGFEPLDNGPLRQARALEGLAFLWIAQAYRQGEGPDFGFAVVRR